jgi:hypothetical protein
VANSISFNSPAPTTPWQPARSLIGILGSHAGHRPKFQQIDLANLHLEALRALSGEIRNVEARFNCLS